MDEIEIILESARRGNEDDAWIISNYLKQFDTVVLRGAGNFGNAFGSFLIEKGFSSTALKYWDVRASELGTVNEIKVELPFSENYSKDNTLIINCIPNGSLSGSSNQDEIEHYGYRYYISGMALFEALICEVKSGPEFDAQICLDTKFCNWCSCKRLSAQMPKNIWQEQSSLVYPLATFVISQKCTLSCTHCGQYINHYTKEEQVNFPIERVKKDIDRLLQAVDGIGYISIIGGEPFVHPELGAIVEYIIGKYNFGVIGITTNGICDINDELLSSLNNGKTRIIFSDYTAALSDNQKKLFDRNVEKVSASGISYTVGKPLWSTPASLRKLNLTEQEKIIKKARCHSTDTCKTVQNGVYYPCSTTAAMGSHHLADFENDWVEIDSVSSAEELRARIFQVDQQPFYESCDHCGEGGEELALSGEQGVSESYIHIDAIKRKKNTQ